MIEPQRWIAQNDGSTGKHTSIVLGIKGAATPESSSVQPNFREDGNLHRITCEAKNSTEPQITQTNPRIRSAFIRVTVFREQSSRPLATVSISTSRSRQTKVRAQVS